MGNLISTVAEWFTGSPDEYNDTNAKIEEYHEMERKILEMKEKAEADAADSQRREAEAKEREEEALRKEEEAREREAYLQKCQEDAKLVAEQARRDLEQARLIGDELEAREKVAKEKEQEAKRLADESKKATLDAQKREREANARVLETQKQEAKSRKAAEDAKKREEEVQKDLEQAKFYLEKGIQPEVWPTEEEFQLAKTRVQYDPEKLHFAVCGNSGTGKSSLINAFRGLKNNSRLAAPTGVVETTKAITRYPEPRKELPYSRLVWFDCPGAGTLEIPGWQYFNQQGLFIFDIIILVYDARFTQIDLSIIQNCERFKIPIFIVRSKADMQIKNIMEVDLGYDEDDENPDDNFDGYQRRARQLLIDATRKNLEENLEKAKLNKQDVFIVTGSVIFSLVNAKPIKKTAPAIDETRLMESILKMAHARRYGPQASSKIQNHSTMQSNTMHFNWRSPLTRAVDQI